VSEVKWGHYVIIHVVGPNVDEVTNVGVILFDENGLQCDARVDNLDRAMQRGDLCSKCGWEEMLKSYPSHFPGIRAVNTAISKTGHAMSKIQCTGPRPTALLPNIMNEIWENFIGGSRGRSAD
jgi:hypothetical protein